VPTTDLPVRRCAVVTGAGSGIGRASARGLARAGLAVGCLDIRAASAEAVAGEIRAEGGRATSAGCDVAEEGSVAAAVAAVAAEFGRLDTVVASAGVTFSRPLHQLTAEEWHRVLGINLDGVFFTLKHTVPHLRTAGGGAIVTIGSVASLVAAARTAAYDASKGGVLQLTRSVANEYAADGIRANCVCPGVVATGLVGNSEDTFGAPLEPNANRGGRVRAPMERAAQPSEIAAVVVFLCSDDASFMTGAAVPVDGGFTAV